MVLVRRARKSLIERRLKVLERDLQSNLDKVEDRAYNFQKTKRQSHRKVTIDIPQYVRDGVLDADLFAIECRLHAEAGIPPPKPPTNLAAGASQVKHMVGFLPFEIVVHVVKRAQKRR